MICRVYELKVDRSHLSRETLDTLDLLFIEAKWFYNAFVASLRSGDVSTFDYRATRVIVKDRSGGFEIRGISYLSSQMRQEILDRAKDSLKSLARLSGSGRKVGILKFKGRARSIPLKQDGMTHRIGGGRVAIQNVAQPLKVRGLDQIPAEAEFANATLERRNDDFYLHLTTFQERGKCSLPKTSVGVDAGVKHQLVLSNGLQIDEVVPLSKKARRLHRELSRRVLRSRNWFKTRTKLNREYGSIARRRADVRHKIVSELVSRYEFIALQDDSITGWQRMWGRRVTTSAVGGIMSDLRDKSHTPVVMKRFEPTTRKCSGCGTLNSIGIEERIYKCEACGLHIDRDLNAAINVWKAVPAERRESTPVDMKASTELMGYFNSIPGVSANLVEEAGSRLPATGARGCNVR